MAGHAQLKCVMTECLNTQIRLTRHTLWSQRRICTEYYTSHYRHILQNKLCNYKLTVAEDNVSKKNWESDSFIYIYKSTVLNI